MLGKRKLKASILLTTMGILSLLFGVLYFELTNYTETLEFTKKAKEKEQCMLMIDVMRDYAKNNKHCASIDFTFQQGSGKVVIHKGYPKIFEYTVTLKEAPSVRVFKEYYALE